MGKFVQWPVRPRLVSFALGTSVLAIAASASPASAQCTPDPTTANGTTNCTGIDANGLGVPTDGTRVIVQPNAIVLPGGSVASIATSGATSTLSIAGSVLGGIVPGVRVTTGDSYYGYLGPCDPYAGAGVPSGPLCGNPYGTIYPSNATAITVGATGTISGSNAILLQPNPNNSAGALTATVVNAGTLTGTAGPALLANGNAYFTQITNQAGGTINGAIVTGTPPAFRPGTIIGNAGTINGGISGAIQSIANTGSIAGDSESAIAASTTAGIASVSITNSGRIVSNGTASTIVVNGAAYIANTGSITNAGGNSAIQTTGFLTLTNAAGATIGSAGAVAIGSGTLTLTNAGTINASVVSTGVSGQYGTIDITAGTINGDLLLGASNDTVSARFDVATGRIAGISGVIDAGIGNDLLNLTIAGDATLGASVISPSFERLGLSITDSTVTLADGLRVTNGVSAFGTGTLINAGSFVTTGQAILAQNGYPGALGLVNQGSIVADMTADYRPAVRVSGGTLTNSGTITATGNGSAAVDVYNYGGVSLINSGTITAGGVGANVSYGDVVNTGTIQSTGGIGAQIYSANTISSGAFVGATTGVVLSSGRFVNTGTVTGTTSGIVANNGAIIDNRSGGTITGAIGIDGRSGYATTIANAGTINGGVDLTSIYSYYQSPDVFIDNGGVVNGAIRLGAGDDLLVTDLVQPSGRGLGGATGGVDAGAGFDSIIYRVGADATAQIGVPSAFEGAGYDLANGAKLTLTATQDIGALIVSGNGSVDVTANIGSNDRTLIDMTAPTVASRLGDVEAPANALDVISRGTLTATVTDSFTYSPVVAVNAGTGRFENAGSITLNGSSAGYYPAFAIVGSGTVINSGTIVLNGAAYGIAAQTVFNSGHIIGAVGGQNVGISGGQSIQNSGRIVTDGPAVITDYYSGSQIVNSGLLESRQSAALTIFENSSILNDTGGTIRGAAGAIDGFGSSVVNRGAIFGDVYLGSYPGYGMSSYVADGGTLAGALTFGEGDDSFVQTGAATGISGVIDGGEGSDAVVLDRAGAGSFTGAINFESMVVDAGVWTLTGAQTYADGMTIAAGATAIGSGSVLNGRIVNTGALVFDQGDTSSFTGTITGTGSLTKAGSGTLTLASQGYTGSTNVAGGTLALTGTLASSVYTVGAGATLTSANAATIASTGGTLSVANAGTIANTNASGRAINIAGANGVRTIAIANAVGGLITSADDAIRVNLNPTGGSIRIDNEGRIETTGGGQAIDFDAAASGAASIAINNYATGVIRSSGQDAIRAGQGAVVTNAGLIRSDGAPNNSYDGIDWQAKTGVVVNLASGTISGLRHGITSDTAVDVTNYGLVQGRNGSGIGSDGTGIVTNYGTITGAWDGVATNGDGDGVDIDGIGTVRNFGTILGLSANGVDSGGQPNGAEGIAMGGGRIENAVGAKIVGASRGVLIDNGSAGSAYGATTIVNAGTIQSGTGAAIALVGAFDDVIVNAGAIVGGSDGIAIDMGAGDDTLALMPGSTITGRVDGGAGNDRVVLAGTGTGLFAGAVNFELLDIQSGNWTIAGASTFSGGIGILGGATLAGTTATLVGPIANAGTLRIDQATDGVFGATLTGPGALVKAGTGSVTIGNQLGFTGPTSILAGRLLVAGTLPSAVTVLSGGTLGGNGTVASATIASGGTIAPGASIGTLTIAGNFVQQAGSIYAAEIGATGLSDRIVVGGTATIQSGARLVVSGAPAAIGTRYTLLTAAGGLTGTYALSQPTIAGTELRLAYAGNALFADVARSASGLVALAGTANQRSIAPAFAALGAGNAAYAALTLVPDAATVTRAFDALSGEVHASLRTAMVHDAQIVQGAVSARTLTSEPSTGLWGTVLANSGHDDGSVSAGQVDRDTVGGVGGVDVALGDGRAGLAGGYTRTKLDDGRASHATAKTTHVLGYAGGSYGAVRVRAGIGYAWTDTRTDRTVAFPGFADRLRADYDGSTAHSFAEIGYALPLGGGTLQPFAGLQALRVRTDGFAETGGPSALTVAKRSESFAFATGGLRFDTPIVDGLSARGVTAWQRRIDGSDPTNVARFSTGSATFDIAGVPLSRDAIMAGIDVVWAPIQTIRVTSGYAGQIGSRGEDSTFRLTASIGF